MFSLSTIWLKSMLTESFKRLLSSSFFVGNSFSTRSCLLFFDSYNQKQKKIQETNHQIISKLNKCAQVEKWRQRRNRLTDGVHHDSMTCHQIFRGCGPKSLIVDITHHLRLCTTHGAPQWSYKSENKKWQEVLEFYGQHRMLLSPKWVYPSKVSWIKIL